MSTPANKRNEQTSLALPEASAIHTIEVAGSALVEFCDTLRCEGKYVLAIDVIGNATYRVTVHTGHTPGPAPSSPSINRCP